jgi:hypothetical protein
MYKTKLACEIYLLKITIFNNLLNKLRLDFLYYFESLVVSIKNRAKIKSSKS